MTIKRRMLGRTGIEVSQICLGSMTWGSQNSEAEAHEQLDYALDREIDFIDTAEMYPTTPRLASTTGRTEEFIGTWIAKPGKRNRVILATKLSGAGNKDIRDGASIDRSSLNEALHASLKRLRTDCIDLYQLHWPNRGAYHFRQWRRYDPSAQKTEREAANFLEVLETLDEFIKAGKIRAIGLSNETAWGTAQYLRIAGERNLPRIATIQNEYSLLCRHFDLDLAELSHHDNVGLLAYSPLASGLLSGKYMNGNVPAGSRMSIQPDLFGRSNDISKQAIPEYGAVAKRHGLDFAQMALAFCLTRPFMTSVIIGATDNTQLRANIEAASLRLSPEVLGEIAEIHRHYPAPM